MAIRTDHKIDEMIKYMKPDKYKRGKQKSRSNFAFTDHTVNCSMIDIKLEYTSDANI